MPTFAAQWLQVLRWRNVSGQCCREATSCSLPTALGFILSPIGAWCNASIQIWRLQIPAQLNVFVPWQPPWPFRMWDGLRILPRTHTLICALAYLFSSVAMGYTEPTINYDPCGIIEAEGCSLSFYLPRLKKSRGKNRGSSTNPRPGYLVAYCSARGRHLWHFAPVAFSLELFRYFVPLDFSPFTVALLVISQSFHSYSKLLHLPWASSIVEMAIHFLIRNISPGEKKWTYHSLKFYFSRERRLTKF